jgi:large subunit ribosomal protein L19
MDWLQRVHGTERPAAGFRPGDEIRVWYRIVEQGKERLGQFEGIVMRSRGSGPSRTFTVRRVTYGEGVERVFPMDAKIISRIEVLRRGSVHRGRLYYLRQIIGKTRIESADVKAAANRIAGGVPVVDATRPERSESALAAAAAKATEAGKS